MSVYREDESWIRLSVESILNQTFKDFEVVLVDNNTPDDSIEIAEKVLKEGAIDYRVVKQTIQGLPAARNLGIREAKGEWIVSIDPDDTVSSRFLADLYESATSNNLSIVFSKYAECGEDILFDFPEENKENVTKQTIAVVSVSVVVGIVIAILDMILQYGVDFIVGL